MCGAYSFDFLSSLQQFAKAFTTQPGLFSLILHPSYRTGVQHGKYPPHSPLHAAHNDSSPCHRQAAMSGQTNVIAELLAAGANPYARCSSGETPLDLAGR